MARYVKISTIGYSLINVDESLSNRGARVKMETYISGQIAQVLPDRPDLILLPEMCDVPRNYDVARRLEYIRERGDANVRYFAEIAAANKCNIAFCTYRFGAGDYTLNTMYVLNRDGSIAGHYNKNHIVIPSELDKNVRCGTEAPIIELDIGRIACAICFDLNFDKIRTHYQALKPDIILFSSMYHGGIVQQFWAQLCRAYFVGAISDSRPSAIISPLGEILAYTTNYNNHVTATVNLDYELAHVDYHAEKFVNLKKKYGPDVSIIDPGNIGYYMLTSECAGVTIAEMFEEFGIKTLDDYLDGAFAAHGLPENRCLPED